MKSDWAITEEIRLEEHYPVWLRLLLLSVGCFLIVGAAVVEFRNSSILPQDAPPILTILMGAFVVLMAIFGRDKIWKIRDGEILVDQKRFFGRWNVSSIKAGDIREIFVSDRSEETGNCFVVEICPTDSPFYVQSPGFKEKNRADELLQEIVRRLGLSQEAIRRSESLRSPMSRASTF